MKTVIIRSVALLLVFCISLGPDLARMAWAQDKADSASDEEIQTIQQLAKAGYLGDKKETYLLAKTLTDEDVTNALIIMDTNILKVDLRGLKPGDERYRPEDLKALLSLVKDREEDIRAQKVSAWIFEHRLQKMIEALAPGEAKSAVAAEPTPTAVPSPVVLAPPTPTPIPGPNRYEWDEMKDSLKDQSKRLVELEDKVEKKMAVVEATNTEIKTSYTEVQEQLKLVQKLIDRVQGDQKKLEDRVEEVGKKANEKAVTDDELKQELTLLRKDLRDNKQDVSILKQEVAKLDAPEKDHPSALDDILGSKWVAGGALLVGITALVVAFTRK